MDFKTFGKSQNPAIMLIHGLGATWRSCQALVELLEADYYLILPVLDGHNPDNRSNYQSAAEEADKIEDYLNTHHKGHLNTLVGFSIGGTIALELLKRGKVTFDQVILDSPCLKTMGILHSAYASMWISQLNKFTKGNDISRFLRRVCGSQDVRNYYNSLFFKLSRKTIQNACREGFGYAPPPQVAESQSRLVYWLGERDANGMKSAKALKRIQPAMRIRIFGGLGQSELFYRFPELYAAEIRNFLNPKEKTEA